MNTNESTNTEGRTLYTSNSFLVRENKYGVEITNMHTGESRWLTNNDLAADVLAVLPVIPARVPAAKIEAASDEYLSQFFDARVWK